MDLGLLPFVGQNVGHLKTDNKSTRCRSAEGAEPAWGRGGALSPELFF